MSTPDERITELEERNENNLAGWRDNVAGLSRRIAELEAQLAASRKAGKHMEANRDKCVALLETEVAEMDQTFKLQRSRSGEAIEWWQKLTGNHKTWPDLGRLLTDMLLTLRLHDAAEAGLTAEIERLKNAETERLVAEATLGDCTVPIGKKALVELHSEVKRLTQWVDDLQAGMYINCVYCGYRYGPEGEVAATMQEALYLHIAQCPKHPLSQAKAEIERLKAEAKELDQRIMDAYKNGVLDRRHAHAAIAKQEEKGAADA